MHLHSTHCNTHTHKDKCIYICIHTHARARAHTHTHTKIPKPLTHGHISTLVNAPLCTCNHVQKNSRWVPLKMIGGWFNTTAEVRESLAIIKAKHIQVSFASIVGLF